MERKKKEKNKKQKNIAPVDDGAIVHCSMAPEKLSCNKTLTC